jgi:two-component sensor histidine kinase
LAATPQLSEINRTRGVAAALASTIDKVLGDNAACSAEMARIVATTPDISFAGFVRRDGTMTCTSNGRPGNVAGPRLDALNRDPRPMLMVMPQGQFTGETVLIVTHPVRDVGGLLGHVSLSIPHRALREASADTLTDNTRRQSLAGLITFDADGTVLTAMYGLESVYRRLPVGQPLRDFVGQEPATFAGETLSGEERSYAVMAIVPNVLYVLGIWQEPKPTGSLLLGNLPLWAVPLAMWLASLTAAWIGAELQVLRPVRSLRRSIITFADGNRTVPPPDLEDAANELHDVGEAYERMISAVIRNEAELEDSLHQKEVLLREVHHRVKNNLQLIASIMNLQMRKSVTPEARQLLKGLQDRVMSLATVHRELYQTSGLTEVDARELLESIVAQVMRMGSASDRPLDASTAIAPIRLSPDQAVPLSLIVTEALTNALKHAVRSIGSEPRISVTLDLMQSGRAVLTVANDLQSNDPGREVTDLEGTGLGHQLLAAFSTQLAGQLFVGEEHGRFVVRLEFPVKLPNPI